MAIANGVGVDSGGNVFVIGRARGQGFTTVAGYGWCVRRSAGRSGTWQTVDAFQYFSQPYALSEAQAVISDATGHVFVAGYGKDANNIAHWIVRKN